MKKILLTTLGAGLLPLSSHAALTAGQTVGIDFGSIAPADGTGFNQFDAFNNNIDDGATLVWSSLVINTGILQDDAGANITGLDFSVENQSGQNTSRADVTNGTTGPAPFNDASVFQDSIISNNQGAAPLDAGGYLLFTFTGLDDSLTYDLTGGYDGANANFDSTWSFDSGSAGISTTQNDSIASFLSAPGATTAYQSVTGLQTDGSGNLVIQVTRDTLHVNAGALTLTAVPVPEPSSAALLGLGGLALILRRRK